MALTPGAEPCQKQSMINRQIDHDFGFPKRSIRSNGLVAHLKRSCPVKINAWCFSNVIKGKRLLLCLDPQNE